MCNANKGGLIKISVVALLRYIESYALWGYSTSYCCCYTAECHKSSAIEQKRDIYTTIKKKGWVIMLQKINGVLVQQRAKTRKYFLVVAICLILPFCITIFSGCFGGGAEKFFGKATKDVGSVKIQFLDSGVEEVYNNSADIEVYVNLYRGVSYQDYDYKYIGLVEGYKPTYTPAGTETHTITFSMKGTGETFVYSVYDDRVTTVTPSSGRKTRVGTLPEDAIVFKRGFSSNKILPNKELVESSPMYVARKIGSTSTLSGAIDETSKAQIIGLLYNNAVINTVTVAGAAAGNYNELRYSGTYCIVLIDSNNNMYFKDSSSNYHKIIWGVNGLAVVALTASA